MTPHANGVMYEPGPVTASLQPFDRGDKLMFIPTWRGVMRPPRPRGPYTMLSPSPTGIPRLRGPRGSIVYRGPGGSWWPGLVERLP